MKGVGRRALMGLAGLLPVGAAFGQSGDMRAFQAQVLEIFRRKYPDISVTPGKDDGSIDIETTTVNLGNIYSRVRSMTAEQRKGGDHRFPRSGCRKPQIGTV